jgi:hypothetical protein
MKKEDFIVQEIFEVTKAEYKSLTLRNSNEIIGPGYYSWVTGVLPFAYLQVKSKKTPEVKELVFAGFHGMNIRRGDKIRTYIHKYHEIENSSKRDFVEQDFIYTERDFRPTEKVSKIEKLTRKSGNKFIVSATFEGLNINDFSSQKIF